MKMTKEKKRRKTELEVKNEGEKTLEKELKKKEVVVLKVVMVIMME